MPYTPIMFVALSFSFLSALTYLAYLLMKMNTIKNRTTGKFILLYVFPTICIFLIGGFIVVLGFIKIELTLIVIFAGAFYATGICLMLYGSPYFGISCGSLAIIVSILLLSINFIEKEHDTEILSVELYDYTEEEADKEEMLIILNPQKEDSTNSSSSSNQDENIVTLYVFKQYDKTKIKENTEFKDCKLNFLLQTSQYELIDDTNERFEITKKIIELHNIYSYFGFSKPSITYEYSYKVFVNENSIKID